MRARCALLGGVGLGGTVLLFAHPAQAQSVEVLDQIVAQFQFRAAGWEGTLRAFAVNTFAILATIEIAWTGFKLAFRGADVSEWLAELVNQILFIGFFAALLQYSVTWGGAIVASFRQAANSAGGGGIAPSDVFAAGVRLGSMILAQMTVWHPEASAGLMLAGIVVLVCFAVMAAEMVLALVESYFIISMSVLFMAFGGSRWTKDFAVSAIRYTVSIGAKLFVIQLLVSVGTDLIQDWSNNFADVTDASLCILIGCSVVLVALVRVLPNTMQRMVSGASMANGSALVGAAAVVSGGVAGVAAGIVGAGAMSGRAYQLASSQMGAADKAAEINGGQAPERSSIARAAALTGGTVRNMASAPIRDIGRRLSGEIGARHGAATWRMGADMANERRLLADDIGKPAPPRRGGGNSLS